MICVFLLCKYHLFEYRNKGRRQIHARYNMQHHPSGLDGNIFLVLKTPKNVFNIENEIEKNVLGNALLQWEKCSRSLGYETEANEIHKLSIIAFKSAIILATKSLRVNQKCRDMVCSIFTPSTSVLANSCCVEVYHRLLCMLHGNNSCTSNIEKSKISSIISFLNSDKEFLEMLKAHQNIEDSHRLLNIFNPQLKLSHSSTFEETVCCSFHCCIVVPH
jgi:hypothetical protein